MTETARLSARLLLTTLLLLEIGSSAAAGADDASWRSSALVGADVRTLVHHTQDPKHVWAGTSGGHVYRSRDGGETWLPAGARRPFPGWVVSTLFFDPDRPGRLWAGLAGVFGGGLVAWSEDHGATWTTPHGVLEGEPVYALVRIPGRAGTLVAGTRRGLLRSLDDGRSWSRLGETTKGLIQVESLWVDPTDAKRIVAGTWRRAFRSEDGGDSWQPVFGGMVEDTDIFSLHHVPEEPSTLWASTCGWLYRSLDAGGTWQRVRDGLPERRTPSFAVVDRRRLIAGTVAGAYVSEDAGATWQRRTGTDLAVSAVAVHPSRPHDILLGTEGAGVWRSVDGGRTFEPSSAGLSNVRAAAFAEFAGAVWVAVNHAGPRSGMYRSFDGGVTFGLHPEPLPTVADLAVSSNLLWAATEQGLFARRIGEARWMPIESLGTQRVEQVEALRDGDLVVVRTATAVYGRFDGGNAPFDFVAIPAAVSPLSIALESGPGSQASGTALWWSDPEGLHRLALLEDGRPAARPLPTAAPTPGGRIHRTDWGMVLHHQEAGGAWLRRALAQPWELLGEAMARFWVTAETPTRRGTGTGTALWAGEDRAGWLWDALAPRGAGTPAPRAVSLPLPVDSRDVLAILRTSGRLLLATSGDGVLYRDLDGSALLDANADPNALAAAAALSANP